MQGPGTILSPLNLFQLLLLLSLILFLHFFSPTIWMSTRPDTVANSIDNDYTKGSEGRTPSRFCRRASLATRGAIDEIGADDGNFNSGEPG